MNLAYIAGIIDGEGCINFARNRQSVFPRVLVTNTDLGLLKDLRSEFGGDITPLSLRRPGWKQGYTWRLSWTKAVDLLDRVSPWLRIKTLQADTVFAWDAIRPSRAGKWDQDALIYLVGRMHALNRKGD